MGITLRMEEFHTQCAVPLNLEDAMCRVFYQKGGNRNALQIFKENLLRKVPCLRRKYEKK